MKRFTFSLFLIFSTLCFPQPLVEEVWTLHFPPVFDYESFNIFEMEKDNQGHLYLMGGRSVSGVSEWILFKIILSSWVIEGSLYFNVEG